MLTVLRAVRFRVPLDAEHAPGEGRLAVDPPHMGNHDLHHDGRRIPWDPPPSSHREAAPRSSAAAIHRAANAVLQEPAVPELRASLSVPQQNPS